MVSPFVEEAQCGQLNCGVENTEAKSSMLDLSNSITTNTKRQNNLKIMHEICSENLS